MFDSSLIRSGVVVGAVDWVCSFSFASSSRVSSGLWVLWNTAGCFFLPDLMVVQMSKQLQPQYKQVRRDWMRQEKIE